MLFSVLFSIHSASNLSCFFLSSMLLLPAKAQGSLPAPWSGLGCGVGLLRNCVCKCSCELLCCPHLLCVFRGPAGGALEVGAPSWASPQGTEP